MEKELKIEVPQGYEIDRQKSTFEKIVFKKIDNTPKTWEEYCKLTRNEFSFYAKSNNTINRDYYYCGAYNEFSTEERAKQFIALGKLLQLRDYWVGDWKINSDSLDNIYVVHNNKDKITEIDIVYYENYSLTFPTKEMANEFITCFRDLIKEAYPLV